MYPVCCAEDEFTAREGLKALFREVFIVMDYAGHDEKMTGEKG